MSSAGELFVSIFGDSSKLDTTLKQIPAQAGTAGRASGSQFASAFQSSFQGLAGKIGKGLGLSMADQMLRGLAEAIRSDKSLGDSVSSSILGAIKNIPILGAVTDLFQAIGEDVTGVLDQKRKQASLQKNIATIDNTLNRRVADEKLFVSLSAQVAENTAKSDFNGAAAAKIKFNAARELERIERETADREKRRGNITDKERERLVELSNLREQLAAQEFGRALRAEEKLTGERLRAINDVAKKKMESDAKDAADFAKLQEKNRREDAEAIEDASAKAMSDYANIATGSASTALGSFKFEAYPPSMQKTIQERTMKAVEKLATQRAETAGIT